MTSLHENEGMMKTDAINTEEEGALVVEKREHERNRSEGLGVLA